MELAKSGVGGFFVIDHDRLEVVNIWRHLSPVSDVGRFKVDSMRDQVSGINPHAHVSTISRRVDWSFIETLRSEVRRADVLVCAADDRECRVVANTLAVEENTPCVFGGARRRAYGLQALVVRPGRGPCYQDFLQSIVGADQDQEVSTPAGARRVGYSDKPVAAEPGLSLDIAPLSNMMAKLALHELLRGKPTGLHCLDEDFEPALYWYLNRRDPDSPFRNLPPMKYEMLGMRVLRWYGMPLERNPNCPVCGDTPCENPDA